MGARSAAAQEMLRRVAAIEAAAAAQCPASVPSVVVPARKTVVAVTSTQFAGSTNNALYRNRTILQGKVMNRWGRR